MAQNTFQQEPMAIVGFACRLPGGNNSPQKLWEFLESGGVAPNKVPKSRFNIDGHYDGSHKPGTMRPPGGMFLSDDIDLAHFDASFFETSGSDAIGIDPNQRQLLEVVYEGLESAGLTLEKLDGAPVACFVGSYSSDYHAMLNRDGEDAPPNFVAGTARAMLANRVSYFLNIKGPSVTVDTACSGSLVGLDLACRSLQMGEANLAIVAASNLFLNPEHVMDTGGMGQAHSPTALCHTFDADADGYVKAEAVNCLIVKRLADAIRDRDPIRAVVRGTASNSNGRTVGGIVSPNSVAQATAIRTAYARAGISDFNETAYLECHGTGTPAGDAAEVNGAGSVFGRTRDTARPLLIGSIKSNLGHAEPAAGISGVIKVILSMEKNQIPGTPTFIKPSPKIDFSGNRVKASRRVLAWPNQGYSVKRASVSSSGFGGSNAHAVIEQHKEMGAGKTYAHSYQTGFPDLGDGDDDANELPSVLVLSANDATALKASINALCNHLINPAVRTPMPDLAYTLSERRSRFFHRAFVTTTSFADLDDGDFVVSKKLSHEPKISFVFTGQGAQWPQMGKDLLKFPLARSILKELDEILQAQPNPPAWTLLAELTEPRSVDHLRQPEFSQPLVTALQLCLFALFKSWGITPNAVVGHSSGEIAAAYAAGHLDLAGAIKAAFYRGRAAVNRKDESESDVGMLAVGLGPESVAPFMKKYFQIGRNIWIACFNSPSSVTVSGNKPTLEALAADIKASGHFARLLHVDLAYHSPMMDVIGDEYSKLLASDEAFRPLSGNTDKKVAMFSSVTASELNGSTDADYWKSNMVSPVRFAEALTQLVANESPDVIIELGPAGALAGPISQILKDKALESSRDVVYWASWARGTGSAKALLTAAGRLFNAGAPIDICKVNGLDRDKMRILVDLPSYPWNHSVKYWHENAASVDWRTKRYASHDLIGSKVLGTSWTAPTWRKQLRLSDVPWLRDHTLGSDVLLPGAAFAAMALEAMYQKHCALHPDETENVTGANDLSYRFRNIKFDRAVVVEDSKPTTVLLTLTGVPGSKDWHEFRVRTTADDVVYEHCWGMIRVQEALADDETSRSVASAPLRHPQSAGLWYKRQDETGTHFGPSFQKIKHFEAVSGRRDCRAALDLTPPPSRWDPQSYYPLHPAALDACFQSSIPAVVGGERSALREVLVPAQIDDMVINKMPRQVQKGMAAAEATWSGRGRKEKNQTWTASIAVRDAETGQLYVRVRGLANNKLDVQERADVHVFQALHWKPDIFLLSQDQLLYMDPSGAEGTLLDDIIDLVAHKTPRLKVLEIAIDNASAAAPLWLNNSSGNGVRAARVACAHYDFATSEAQTLVAVQSAHSGYARDFHLLHASQDALGLPATGPTYDLAIVRGPTKTGDGIIDKIRSLLKPCGVLLRVPDESDVESANGSGVQTPSSSSSSSGEALSETSEGSGFLVDTGASTKVRHADEIEEMLVPGIPAAWLSIKAHTRTVAAGAGPLLVLQFDDSLPPLAPGLRTVLTTAGWKLKTASVSKLSDISQAVAQAAAVLVVDEMAAPVLANISERQWEALKQVASSRKPLVWVTKGSQTAQRVTDPDRALVHGLFRTFRREELGARLTTLDVQSAASPAAHRAVERVLSSTYSRPETCDDYEYAERDGVLLVSRLMVDDELNAFKAASGGTGLEPITKGLHSTNTAVRLRAEVVGSLQKLVWSETGVSDLPLADGSVEVEVVAVGANFKDVATAMGIVPENEYMLGFECSGIVRRVGAGAASRFRPGDRVVAHTNGSYANRVQTSADRVHAIPDTMSFEDAATIPVVYVTVVYSLFHLAHLRQGQSILIHSAAGGVGIAAIQLAQYAKADIFVTVGSDEKRELLMKEFGLSPDRIFSSRNIGFADAIRRATNGRGVDVVLNSLVGELLDESWRLTADGGTMVEIGKRDIVDRNTLAMEPFNRNCSFRAVDLSYTPDISDALIAKLLAQVFDLVNAGHIGPVHPVTVYGFDQVIDALSEMRSGKHMGKIVISSGTDDVKLPIRPAVRQLELKADATYLLVGGLKGACGSLAVHMARHGARHLISLSRSGMGDKASAKIVEHCASYGCQIAEAKGDVGDLAFVSALFRFVQHGHIAGVIQGAMVTRDKPYELMTHDDYHTAIHAKVRGTWNLHLAAQQEQKQPLDFFSLLSSVSGVTGMKGQANYAAANVFLDAFAHYRQSQGLHANSIDLGVIEEVGFIAEMEGGDELAARFDPKEWPPINEDMLRQILTYSILQQDDPRSHISGVSTAQLISGLGYPLPANATLADNPRFDYLFNASAGSDASSDESASSDSAIDQAIRAFKVQHTSGSPDAALIKTALQILQSQVTLLLRLETEIEPGKPLLSYGLDSLSAVELRGWIRHRLGAELSTLDITNASSLVALCEKLVDKLPRADGDK